MASKDGSEGASGLDGIAKLRADAETLAQEAHARTAAFEEQQERLRTMTAVQDQMLRPATINKIEIHGAKNTRRNFLNPLLEPLLSETNNAGSTLGDVLTRLRQVSDKLDRFEIFKPEPTIFLSEASSSDGNAAATDLDVAIRVIERGSFMLKTGTDLGNTEGSAYANMLWRNMFGGAETLSANASLGTRTRSSYSAVLSAPVNSNPDVRASVEALASATQKPWASHEEVLKGATARLGWVSESGDTQSVALGSAWRQLTGLAPMASPSVRRDAGDSVKTALSYTFTRDRRDHPMLPQSGYLARVATELAGWGPLGGDVSFSKSEVEIAGALPLLLSGGQDGSPRKTGFSIGGGLRLGVLYPLPLGFALGGQGVKTAPSRINDRFTLGGPTDVRGFKLGGLGPRDGPDAVGGDVFAAGSVNMLMPLPRTGAESPLRLQLFANGGRLIGLNPPKTRSSKDASGDLSMSSGAVYKGMKSAIGELGNGLPSISAGVGLVYAHPVARFELNFSLPLVMRRGEEGRKGLQVGVGINFL